MSNYVPRVGALKKKDILAKREEELRRAVRAGDPPHRIERAAEMLRAAQLAVIKALLHEEFAYGKQEKINTKYVDNLKEKERQWLEMSVIDIVAIGIS